ncbi:hypothetical protein ACF0H5_004536 [Mactra antiquata]
MSKSVDGDMTRFAYLRHKFTTRITSASKKSLWDTIHKEFTLQADVPRTCSELVKKWDNLVQKSRAQYSDFVHERNKTGGGQCTKELSPVIDAVMSLIGKHSINVNGIHSSGDSTRVMIDLISVPELTNFCVTETGDNVNQTTEGIELFCQNNSVSNLSCNQETRTEKCCKCSWHLQYNKWQDEKIKLEIKLLKRQLGADECK